MWVVTWGRPGRVDWHAAYVVAFDPDDALVVARSHRPELLPPSAAAPATSSAAAEVLAGRMPAGARRLPVLR